MEAFFINVTWQLTLHICPHGSLVLFAAEVLYFVLNSLHGEAGFIAAFKTTEEKGRFSRLQHDLHSTEDLTVFISRLSFALALMSAELKLGIIAVYFILLGCL